jgi:CheY-like chemotaxis protein
MVLIVDDVPGVIVAFGLALTRLGVSYVGAGSVAEARQLLPQHRWTGFILDLELPDGSGLDVLDTVRANPDYRLTPVAIITANLIIDDQDMQRLQRGNATLHCGVFAAPETDAICGALLDRIWFTDAP